jgi:hypothetical protein
VVIKVLMLAGIAVLPLPALVLGTRGFSGRRRYGGEPADRASRVVLVALRLLALLLLLALSAITLLSLIGALVNGVSFMPGLVYVFFLLDLLLAALVMLTFGRRARQPARRPASPAAR